MDSKQNRSVDEAIGETLRNLGADNEDFLSEDGLARAIIQSQQLAVDFNPAAFTELKIGDKLGDFEIESKLAQGGMGIIYSAIQRPLGRRVALKTVIPRNTTKFTLERFRRERKLLGELHESNIVSIFAAGLENGIEYFAMPFISGRSLKEIVSDEKKNHIPAARAVEIVIDLAEGAEAIHEQGIIHRDITPNNVILDDNERAWLIDFGIATRVDRDGKNKSDLEVYDLSTDGRMGTPRYKAPELERGIAGKQTDVFGLGVCFYCLLSGSDFSFETFRSTGPTKRESFYQGLPDALVAVCKKALNENPEQRYQTAGEFSEDLRRWLRNEPVSSKVYQPHQRMWLWVKRNPIKSVATFASFLVVTVVAIAAIVNAESKANENAARLKSRLSQMEAILLAGDFEKAESVIADDGDMLEVSAAENPDLFLKLIALLWRTRGINAAQQQITVARNATNDEAFLARLDLAEADVLYVKDFARSELLARSALNSDQLNDTEENFAKALLATNAIAEQKCLKQVVEADPFHLRAQQLLVMNMIFLGQELTAREQLASGRSLFPRDPSLALAAELLKRLNSRPAIQLSKTQSNSSPSKEDDATKEPSSRVLEQGSETNEVSDSITRRVLHIFPEPKLLEQSHREVVMANIDDFLTGLYLLQKDASNIGFVIFPPTVYRALSRFKIPSVPARDPRYWATLEHFLQDVSDANPDMLLLFAHARSIYSQNNATAEQWKHAEQRLEQSLLAESVFPIRSLVIQELALARIQIHYYVDGRSKNSKEKMVIALKLLNQQERMQHFDIALFSNIVEAAYEAGESNLAADFCEKWRKALEEANSKPDDQANALGYSAMVALSRNHFFEAFNWSSKAIEIAPSHQFHRAHKSFQKKAAEKLPEIAKKLAELNEDSDKSN